MSVRQALADDLAAHWPTIPALADVRVVATERALDDIRQPTALIRQTGIARLPEAPASHRSVSILLTLISKHADMDRAADELDVLVDAALDYLDPRYQHEDATAVAYAARLAYDIPLTIIAAKE